MTEKRETVGIVFGCFIPLHAGHKMLIETAIAENDRVIIGVCGSANDRGRDFVPFRDRFELISQKYASPNVKVVQIDDDKISMDGTFTLENWRVWGAELFSQAGESPDGLITWYMGEESYKDKLSQIYPRHCFRIFDRREIPLSGTEIRENFQNHAEEIDQEFLNYLEKKRRRQLRDIIRSLLETDLYKFSMGQAIYHQFPTYTTTWTFKCRNEDVFFTSEMVEEIRAQIRHYCSLRFTEEELGYLRTIEWFKDSYIDFLRLWHPRYEDFTISTDVPCGLSIETNGTWLNTSMYEIPTLAIVNEVYFRMKYNYDELFWSFKEKLADKVKALREGTYKLGGFSEFGLRRRLSREAQDLAVRKLAEAELSGSTFVGTSNVYLAKKYNVKPVGTMAHEWIMCVGQGNHKHNPAYSNWFALDAWVKEYGVLNGTALTDTITTDCFLKDFRRTYSTLFNGVRHDSGDPMEWGDKMIAHYKSLRIDPKTKVLLFSDSLNFERADQLRAYFEGRIQVAFGIGTFIANDTFAKPLNIVMKTTMCNGDDVAKLSDTEGKGMCKNEDYIAFLKETIRRRMAYEEKIKGKTDNS